MSVSDVIGSRRFVCALMNRMLWEPQYCSGSPDGSLIAKESHDGPKPEPGIMKSRPVSHQSCPARLSEVTNRTEKAQKRLKIVFVSPGNLFLFYGNPSRHPNWLALLHMGIFVSFFNRCDGLNEINFRVLFGGRLMAERQVGQGFR